MPSPVYRILTAQLPSDLTGASGNQLEADLQGWRFDPNETDSLLRYKKPPFEQPLLLAFLSRLPKALKDVARATRITQLLLDRGADPRALGPEGERIEDLGPTAMRTFLVSARGGDLTWDADTQHLLTLVLEGMWKEKPMEHLEDHEEVDGQGTRRLGHPTALWVLALAPWWTTSAPGGVSGSAVAGIARARASHVRQLLRWAKSTLPANDAEDVAFLGWCVAAAHATDANKARAAHWDPVFEALHDDGRLAQAERMLARDWGEATGHVATAIADAVVGLNDPRAPGLWARAMDAVIQQPGALDRVASNRRPRSDTPYRRFRQGAPASEAERGAWLDGFSVDTGTRLTARALRWSTGAEALAPQAQPDAWLAWARAWLDRHPDQTGPLHARVAADVEGSSLNIGDAMAAILATLDGWRLAQVLPDASPRPKPRM